MRVSIHRPTKIQVDLLAISNNLEQVKNHLPNKTKVFAVVKANAYGHGAVAVARQLESQVDGFCVSNLDEALELRQAGILQQILILGVVPVEVVPLAISERMMLTVPSLEWVEQLLECEFSLQDLQVHVKVDTGMGRIGFRESRSLNQAMNQLRQKSVVIDGIFTHFATADEKDDNYFQVQRSRFQEILAEVEQVPACIHASNSATSIWHTDTTFTMVRLGNILYGLNPSGHELALPYPIQSVLQLTSELVHVKEVERNASIGYGATYHSTESEYIGTVPIGYADGFLRNMQGFSLLIEGELCPVVGRVSMDQITVRLPKRYNLGTSVTLIGQSGHRVVSVQDWADYLGTINYEVVCALSSRIPRYYDDKI
ncbi:MULTISPECIES: alanine racemase [unclassified Streptococcus]|uniref:alanine racemase n=1 Tax=unclassified Streptococcus TaxID=2608887 RepID=UPI001071B680|nr:MULTISPECIES: alanine racemase [unclassified Streptococcus]MBF0788301.1 alanine racemase [Streptococcus sp. 19428wC2_LYSM12]MCQ9211270.1 alanine racemase [Streptococcus sp. B01]MCQ9214583.1 alanine racemase [Streptococcus sp. O1]TFV04610.1 alanine racemase [Streptococcus sp. LYSM12]